MYKLRFRQVHLDFHTSEAIKGIGSKFDKKQFQNALKAGHVDSVTCFAKCHHGWNYYESKISPMHPNLEFDLLRAQFDACREIDVNVPVYISAGFDEYAARENPEWVTRHIDEQMRQDFSPIKAMWRKLCFNSPYIEYLCEQIKEVMHLYPDCNGIFLDIISQLDCGCKYCLKWIEENGMSATDESARHKARKNALNRYYELTTAAVRDIDPDMPIFHNSGHIQRGNIELLKYFSHLELESLPTGGWGYDHFPLSAKYCKNLPFDMLGMTGKFHTTWGEFGGFKHPNALLYECAAMVAYGAKCSVGDQLHPLGDMNMSTYNSIGKAYEHVEKCEPFCDDVNNVAEIAILSAQSLAGNGNRHLGSDPDIGATRILLESHVLFDVIDGSMDFGKYKLIILPDTIDVNKQLKVKLDQYLQSGGKILLTGRSGIATETGKPVFDIGAQLEGQSPYCPDYMLPIEKLRPEFLDDPIVMYMRSHRLKVTDGQSLGQIYDPYFNREYNHFCSHQHTPNNDKASGYDAGVIKGNVMYLAHPVFSIYRGLGAVAYRQYLENAIKYFLGSCAFESNLPSTARVSLMDQPENNRMILHLLYAATINRGGPMKLEGGNAKGQTASIEVVEELTPLRDINIKLKTDKKIKSAKLQPQNQPVEFETLQDGSIGLNIDEFTCHQMIELSYTDND